MTHHMQTPASHLAYLTAQNRIPAASVLALHVAVMLSKWAMRRRTRLSLRTLDPHILRDIGLTQAEADFEARRVFWRM
ncbi:DUF1127 domain-containing protein [Tateyamaria omphalii]|uniref:YjiS-like domain-containing protein n=1 Tax=Tateyamaria omphalii TaxID=299262 RepID=A0A1P8MUE7_9RHOB|nr:DUF1127 domain-containing protein [Tateyamaria omphalii]APX11622.1 hypothetical protein BWR18_07945 [Tateyamaria omphalii]